MANPEQLPAWHELTQLAETVGRGRIYPLFAADAGRGLRYSVAAASVTLDYSKQRINDAVLASLVALAKVQDFEAIRAALFAGDPINNSENRAAWHVALRRPDSAPLYDEVHAVRAAMKAFVDSVRAGDWRGFTGEAITDVVNIGIGGSDLGPRLVCQALASQDNSPRAHFVSNVDPADLDDTLALLDAATTLIIVTSKSFTTAETLANARAARQWLFNAGAGQADIARHFVAVSTNESAVRAFGI